MSANKNHLINDNFPKVIKNSTSTSDGLMSAEDKTRLDSVFEFGLLTPATPDKDGIMTKEDKTKLDGIEEGANNYVHPDNGSIRHVTDTQITKWNNQIKYTNSKPIPIDIGGITKGTTFQNVDYSEIFNKLLYPYVQPTLSNILIHPDKTILEKGETFNLTRIKFNIEAPSLLSTDKLRYEFKLNSTTQFHWIETVNRSIDELVNTSINDTTSIDLSVIDNINNKNTPFNLINYTFIYPFYYGDISLNDVVNELLIRTKNKLIEEKSDKKIRYTTVNKKMMFAYPKVYGKLKAIIDTNDFNVLSTFTVQEMNITSNDGKVVAYYVYINDVSTVTDYLMYFIF